MTMKASVDQPNEKKIAEKRQAKRDAASVAEAMKQANSGIKLLRSPEGKAEKA